MALDVGELLEHALGRRVDLEGELRHLVLLFAKRSQSGAPYVFGGP